MARHPWVRGFGIGHLPPLGGYALSRSSPGVDAEAALPRVDGPVEHRAGRLDLPALRQAAVGAVQEILELVRRLAAAEDRAPRDVDLVVARGEGDRADPVVVEHME